MGFWTRDAMYDYLEGKTPVGIMGSHSLKRGSDHYALIVYLSRKLARAGFLVGTSPPSPLLSLPPFEAKLITIRFILTTTSPSCEPGMTSHKPFPVLLCHEDVLWSFFFRDLISWNGLQNCLFMNFSFIWKNPKAPCWRICFRSWLDWFGRGQEKWGWYRGFDGSRFPLLTFFLNLDSDSGPICFGSCFFHGSSDFDVALPFFWRFLVFWFFFV